MVVTLWIGDIVFWRWQ